MALLQAHDDRRMDWMVDEPGDFDYSGALKVITLFHSGPWLGRILLTDVAQLLCASSPAQSHPSEHFSFCILTARLEPLQVAAGNQEFEVPPGCEE